MTKVSVDVPERHDGDESASPRGFFVSEDSPSTNSILRTPAEPPRAGMVRQGGRWRSKPRPLPTHDATSAVGRPATRLGPAR